MFTNFYVTLNIYLFWFLVFYLVGPDQYYFWGEKNLASLLFKDSAVLGLGFTILTLPSIIYFLSRQLQIHWRLTAFFSSIFIVPCIAIMLLPFQDMFDGIEGVFIVGWAIVYILVQILLAPVVAMLTKPLRPSCLAQGLRITTLVLLLIICTLVVL